MNNDLGDQPKPTQTEGQPKERVIEVNEWFTPFENYYDTKDHPGTDTPGSTKEFQLANVGKFEARLSWWQDSMEMPEDESEELYLLVLPTSEKLIDIRELKTEQDKMETKPLQFDFDFDETLRGKELPFSVEAELPSGQIISGELPHRDVLHANQPISLGNKQPSPFGHWNISGDSFVAPMLPETENIINKFRMRFVPKE